MKRIKVPTKDVVVPSGYTVTIKTKQTYGDSTAIRNRVLGDLPVDATEIKTTIAQANSAVVQTLLVVITAWDVTEEDDSATPLTEENIVSILTDEDVNFLMPIINGAAVPDPKL